mmetsp:Transcript_31652/g.62707  ORF Transcript_31652/g.62707 Transcript_31652/m.62707 type:complete len:314 (+) Transcript_31652:293-1234(+)|eukprot:CAMPEP_0194305328 /NCGR_PEP_ID=MMETSP0171-20130528/2793_1 /TAXON_ID=218684 /ORGANISM="Corethron pennatum, Strain L29A3" /LENGTH=313 /DNA_ID=CAMNT_0039056825 /DNA_START=232 /DNA_END=1173 /DNA_ORIENTATION=+
MTSRGADEPFAFDEVMSTFQNPFPEPPELKITASDGVKLAVRTYRPGGNATSKAALLFFHGGGAHATAGYHAMARKLSDECGITVHTPDLRGHGASQGPRGDAPSAEQLWRDVDSLLEFVREDNQEEGTPIFLGGHSSGAGLVLNYTTWAAKPSKGQASAPSTKVPIAGYLLLSPQLGYVAKVDRPDQKPRFARVSVLSFIVNGLSGGLFLGHSRAVRFNYPQRILDQDPLLVAFNTVNMANGISPEKPRKQMEALEAAGDMGLWIGADDELFIAEKVAGFAKEGKVIPQQTHVGIVLHAHKWLGPWLLDRIK